MYIHCQILFILICFSFTSLSQDSTKVDNNSPKSIFTIGLTGYYGTIFAHSESVQNTKGANPVGLSIETTWKLIGEKTWQQCNCTPRMGFYLSLWNYDVKLLGKSVILSYFLEPNFSLTRFLQLNFRAATGLAYLTNPYHPENNPTNLSYSLPLSGYLSLGLSLGVQVNHNWGLILGGHYKHISNGGIKDPNKGINWPVLSLGVEFTPNPVTVPKREKSGYVKRKTPVYTAFLIWGNKNVEVGDKARYFIWSAILQAGKQVGKLNALTLGLETYYDLAAKEKMRRDNISKSPFGVALLTGHEFLLGKFTFSQQLGWYLYQDTPYHPFFYHRWGVNYNFYKRLLLGFNMKAHYQVADFLDIRLGYRFN